MKEDNYPKPSTMVAVVNFDAFIYLENLFWVLPVIRDNSLFVKRASPRSRFDWVAKPSTILVVKYKKRRRGIAKKDDKKTQQLKNNLNMDMSLQEKNINLNLGYSRENKQASLQITGVNSKEMVDETYEYVCHHLRNLQQKLDYIHFNPLIIRELKNKIEERKNLPLNKNGLINEYNSIFFEIFESLDSWSEFEKYIDYIF